MSQTKYYVAVVTEKTSPVFGHKMYNTKSKGDFNGMTKEQFTEAVKGCIAWTFEVKEM